MAQLVADCPRCGAKRITFDLWSTLPTHKKYGWQNWYEVFCVCQHCFKSTVFVVCDNEQSDELSRLDCRLQDADYAINRMVRVEGSIGLKDRVTALVPEHVPAEIASAFQEGARCRAVECPNAAGAMFRLCVDLGTRALLPAEDVDGLNRKIRRDLGLRLPWLFQTNRLPVELEGLSHCIREDGNDGAHAGTLTADEAEDLMDFTVALLERLYTIPKRLELAQERREKRRESRLEDGT